MKGLILASLVGTLAMPAIADSIKVPIKEINKIKEGETRIMPMVIGGNDADASKYPFYARLVNTNWDGEEATYAFHTCGASILDVDHIITAAHCVDDSYSSATTPSNSGITLETTNPMDTTKVMQIDSITIHPNWNSDELDNDIAIIKLKKPISDMTHLYSSQKIQSIELPSSSDRDFYNAVGNINVIGLGATGGAEPVTLQEAEVYLESDTYCKSLLSSNDIAYASNDDVLMCMTATASDSMVCPGDSGGPSVYINNNGEYHQIGIASFVANTSPDMQTCSSDNFAFYTELLGYSDWITSITGPLTHYSYNPDGEETPSEEVSTGGGSGGAFSLALLMIAALMRKKSIK